MVPRRTGTSEGNDWSSRLIRGRAVQVIVDVTVAYMALPAIKHDLLAAQDNLQWVITAYAILFERNASYRAGRRVDLLELRRCSWPTWRC